MKRAEGSSEGGGRHLADVHGSQAGEEPAEQADDQATGDHHLVGGADGGEAHEEAADHRQRVHQEHGAAPEETRQGDESLMWCYETSFSIVYWNEDRGGAAERLVVEEDEN